MNPEGPYVSAAAICEAVLHEKDEKISLIRFIDSLDVRLVSADENAAARLRLNAFIGFKSGSFIGNKTCSLELFSPSGKKGKFGGSVPRHFPMTFKGGGQGYNLILALDLPVVESGTYWFDVMLDEVVYTRIPLKVNITRIQPQTQPENSQQVLNHPA